FEDLRTNLLRLCSHAERCKAARPREICQPANRGGSPTREGRPRHGNGKWSPETNRGRADRPSPGCSGFDRKNRSVGRGVEAPDLWIDLRPVALHGPLAVTGVDVRHHVLLRPQEVPVAGDGRLVEVRLLLDDLQLEDAAGRLRRGVRV